MLVTPKSPALVDHQLEMIYKVIGQPTGQWIATGIYEQSGFRSPPGVSDRYDPNSFYGVCDNVQQILDKFPIIQHTNLDFCISLTKINKADQPADMGWRWHKWGAYIGTHDIKCEYLYHEVGIESVYVFHVYQLADNRSHEEKIKDIEADFESDARGMFAPRIISNKVLLALQPNGEHTRLVILEPEVYLFHRFYRYKTVAEAQEAITQWEYSDSTHPPGNWTSGYNLSGNFENPNLPTLGWGASTNSPTS